MSATKFDEDRSQSSYLKSRADQDQRQDVPEAKNFTEVFSWGNDKFGQLGLG